MDPREHADLERRVQAHEELLAALVVAVALEHPAALTRLEGMFAEREASGQGYADTVGHVQALLRSARRQVGAN